MEVFEAKMYRVFNLVIFYYGYGFYPNYSLHIKHIFRLITFKFIFIINYSNYELLLILK